VGTSRLPEIVDAYLKPELDSIRFESGETLDLEVATEFLLIAATLVELKTAPACCPGPSEPRARRGAPPLRGA